MSIPFGRSGVEVVAAVAIMVTAAAVVTVVVVAVVVVAVVAVIEVGVGECWGEACPVSDVASACSALRLDKRGGEGVRS